jgi:hypothetical protein
MNANGKMMGRERQKKALHFAAEGFESTTMGLT